MCRLALAWVTSENSTKQLECRHLDSIFFAGPYLLCWSHRSGVRCSAPVRGSTPTLSADSPFSCTVANSLVRVPSSTLSRVPLPLPDTARFQVQKSFVWFRAETDKGIVCSGHPYSATLHSTESDGNVPVLEIRGMGNTPSWLLLPYPLKQKVEAPGQILSMDQTDSFAIYLDCNRIPYIL